jgi:hypothetical protein
MIEIFIDDCHLFEEKANRKTIFGGWLSVQKESKGKALIMFRHNECIFKQHHMTTSAWKAPSGEIIAVPKDDGQNVMVSGFQSRKLGFGLHLKRELLLVNNYQKGSKYGDEKAAQHARGTEQKQLLTKSPFIKEF